MRVTVIALFLLFSILYAGAQNSATINKRIKAIQLIRNDSIRLDSLYNLAWANIDEQPKEGIAIGKLFLKDAEASKNEPAQANAMRILGLGYEQLSDYPQSLHYYLEALEIRKRLNSYALQIALQLGIGRIYDITGDQPKHLQYVKEAMAICNKYPQDDAVNKRRGRVLDALATAFKNQGYLDTAITLYKQSIEIAEKNNDTNSIVPPLCNLATALKSKKEYTASLAAYTSVVKLLDTVKYASSHAVIASNMAILFFDMGNMASAETYARKALSLQSMDGQVDVQRDSYDLLKKIYLKQKKYAEALAYFEKWVSVKDTILNSEKSRQMKEMQTKYDTEAKDRQIQTQIAQISYNKKINFFLALVSLLLLSIGVLAYLNQRMTAKLNRQIISQKKEVEQLNDVKDRIFSVISHDMRTPVNSLIAFTELLERGNIPPEKMVAYSASLKNNLGYTAGLMENLLNWARTQMQGYKPVFETFDIAACAAQAVGLLKQEAEKKGIIIRNEIPADSLVYADINMSSLLIRNLLSNAVKYTPGGGSIVLSAAVIDNKLQVKVTDTGIGVAGHLVDIFNSNSSQPIDSTPGTNHEKGTGLGLMLCKSFAVLMKGTITLESNLRAGSCFTVSLPRPE